LPNLSLNKSYGPEGLTFFRSFARALGWREAADLGKTQGVMETLSNQSNNALWLRPALSPEELSLMISLREQIYRGAGKVAEGGYTNPLDAVGEAFLVMRGSRAIGTFSLCNLSKVGAVAKQMAEEWGIEAEELRDSLSVYFLGIESAERRADALKFVFGEIFKYLVRHRLTGIYVLADARLTKRYRWIGLLPRGQQVMSIFPKSGSLSLLYTRQIRAGIYGFHADPIRWNWYLRAPIAELLRSKELPRPALSHAIYRLYGLCAPLAAFAERLASTLFLCPRKNASRRFAHVRSL